MGERPKPRDDKRRMPRVGALAWRKVLRGSIEPTTAVGVRRSLLS